MQLNLFQCILIGILSYLGSLSSAIPFGLTGGWYTLSRPLVSGFLIGLICGDVTTGILVGVSVQVVFIALVTPGGQMPQDLNSAAYIGVALCLMAVKSNSTIGSAVAIATAVGAVGTIFHNFMMITNTVWNTRAIIAIEKADYRGLMLNHLVFPQIIQFLYRVVPTALILYFGQNLATKIIEMFPIDSFVMRTLTVLGGMLPAVGVAILLKQITKKNIELIRFLFGFVLVAVLGMNMISVAIIGIFFAYSHFIYTDKQKAAVNKYDDDEEEL